MPDSPEPVSTANMRDMAAMGDVSSWAGEMLELAADELDTLRAEVARRRRIVQITSIDDYLCALCSDGTVWKFQFGSWTEYPALPDVP